MRKAFLSFILVVVVFITGCNSDNYTQIIADLEYQHAQLQDYLRNIQRENDDLHGTICRLEGFIEVLEEYLEAYESTSEEQQDSLAQNQDDPSYVAQQDNESPFQGLTVSYIRQNLIENSNIILETVGGSEITIFEDDILVSASSVLAQVTIPVGDWPMDVDVILLYHRVDESIAWSVFAYSTLHTGMQLTAPLPEQQQPLPTNEDIVTLRFYQYSDWDQYTVIYDIISWENWRAETIGLMQENTGISIRDIRYDGTRLYVDIFPIAAIPFNWGSTGGWIRTQTLVNSMASLPGVEEIVILIGGEGGHWADHFDFSLPFDVR